MVYKKKLKYIYIKYMVGENKKIIEMQDKCINNISQSINELKDLVNESNKELKKQNNDLEKLDSDINNINKQKIKTQTDVDNLSGKKKTPEKKISENIEIKKTEKTCNLM